MTHRHVHLQAGLLDVGHQVTPQKRRLHDPLQWSRLSFCKDSAWAIFERILRLLQIPLGLRSWRREGGRLA